MAVRPDEIASIIKQQIEQFGGAVTAVDVGSVVESGDGIARIYGLSNCNRLAYARPSAHAARI